MKDVSIIFVNYNTRELTINAIASIYKFTKTLAFEIIVVDNNSKDNSIKEISKNYPEVIIIKNSENIGFGRANNKGVDVAKGKYLFFLNTDTYLINDAINVLFDFMSNPENIEIGVCGAMLYKQDLSPNVYAGNFPSFESFIKGSFWKYFFFKYRNIKNEYKILPEIPDKIIEVDYVSGAAFFVRKEIIDEVGSFNPRFFMYYEEVELTYRIKFKARRRSVVVPKSKIVHISQGSSNVKNTSRKFQIQKIKSAGTYYRLTEGKLAQLIYLITNFKRLYFN